MDKTQYMVLRRTIRTNGINAASTWALRHQDFKTLDVIDQLINQCIEPIDWLKVREDWTRELESVRLTTWVTL